MLIAFSPTL
jgi:hypothetical protein